MAMGLARLSAKAEAKVLVKPLFGGETVGLQEVCLSVEGPVHSTEPRDSRMCFECALVKGVYAVGNSDELVWSAFRFVAEFQNRTMYQIQALQ